MTHVDRAAFSAAERDFIRREFCKHFGSFPTLADGIFLRAWRSGPKADQPKTPKALSGLIERGLVDIPPGPQPRFGVRAYFTPTGLTALHALLQDRRRMDPERFAHLRQELGLDPVPTETAPT